MFTNNYSPPSQSCKRATQFFVLLILLMSVGCNSTSNHPPTPTTETKPKEMKKENACENDDGCTDGECVNKVCQPYKACGTGDTCEQNHTCLKVIGKCVPNATICKKLACDAQPGICKPEESTDKCVDAGAGCERNNDCLPGRECGIAKLGAPKECQPIKCTDGKCSRGTCNDSTGNCEDKLNDSGKCQTNKDCVSGKYCVPANAGDNEGTCIEEGEVCKTSCRGNQTCSYPKEDGKLGKVTCETNATEGCFTANDCNDGERCVNKGLKQVAVCEAQPATCSDDQFSPNHDEASATDYEKIKGQSLVLCKGDDWYEFEAPAFSGDGKISVELKIAKRDIGVKDLTVALYKEGSPTEITSGRIQKDETTGSLKITHTYSASDAGKYKIKVSSSKDYSLEYMLFVDTREQSDSDTITVACNAAKEDSRKIKFGSFQTATVTSHTTKLSPQCSPDPTGQVTDDIWSFELDKRSNVTFVAETRTDVDAVLEVRKACQDDESTVRKGCSNLAGANSSEELSVTLDPGTYYLLVTFPSTGKEGNYTLSSRVNTLKCERGYRACQGNTFEYCSDDETHIITENCQHCSSDQTVCEDRLGDTCEAPIVVTETEPLRDELINLSKFHNTFKTASGCGNVSEDNTTGNDVVIMAKDVPPGDLFVIDTYSAGKISLYFATDCHNISQTCIADYNRIGDKFTSTLSWTNKTSAKQTVYAVIDYTDLTSTNGTNPTSMKVNAQIIPKECEPGNYICHGGNRQLLVCNEYGQYIEDSFCVNGCEDANGAIPAHCRQLPENSCTTTETIVDSSVTSTTAPIEKSIDFSKLQKNSKVFSACGAVVSSSSSQTSDAIYKIETVKDTQYTITLTSTDGGGRPLVWLADICDTGSGGASVCLDADQNVGGASTTLNFIERESNKTHYIVAEQSTVNILHPTFKLSVEVAPASTQLPYKLLGCHNDQTTYPNIVRYTDKNGSIVMRDCMGNTTECDPSTSLCKGGDGRSCVEPKLIYDYSSSTSDNGNYTDNIGNVGRFANEKLELVTGDCYFEDNYPSPSFEKPQVPSGRDYFYAFNLEAQQTLTVDFLEDFGSDDPNLVAYFQDKEACANPKVCHGGIIHPGKGTISYKAESNKTIYLVVKEIKDTTNPLYNHVKKHDFSVTWSVTKTKYCAPNTSTCLDSSTLRSCSLDGTTSTDYECDSGCINGRCDVDPSNEGSSCGNAIDVGTGGIFYIDKKFSAPFTYGFLFCGSPNYTTKGPGAYFAVTTTKPNQTISIDARSLGRDKSVVILSKNCGSINSFDCKNKPRGFSSDFGFEHPAIVTKKLREAGETYYFYVASHQRNNIIPKYIRVKLEDPSCDTESFTNTCEPATKTITYCEDGEIKTEVCSTGCDKDSVTCSGDAPLHTGTKCFNPTVLDGDANTLINQTWKGTDNDNPFVDMISSGQEVIDGCVFEGNGSRAPKGYKTYYSVKLNKGDTFEASIDIQGSFTSNEMLMYISKGCSSVSQCMTMSNQPGQKQKITFVAPTNGIYNLVVDSYRVVSRTWDLSYKITHPDLSNPDKCVSPHTGYCDGNDLRMCKTNLEYKTYTCPYGCEFGKCKITGQNNICTNAQPIADGAAFTLPMRSKYGNNFNVQTQSACFDGHQVAGSGTDAYFSVDLKPYEEVRVYSKRVSAKEGIILYGLYSCEASNHVPIQCIEDTFSLNANPSNDVTGGFSYRAGANPISIYIALDGSKFYQSHAKQVYFEINEKECDPDDATATYSCDGDAMQYCRKGVLEKYTCEGTTTCDDQGGTVQSVCAEPKGDACPDPKIITLDPTSHSTTLTGETFAGATNQFNPKEPNRCTRTRMPGVDRIYKVHVPAGKTLTARATSSSSPPEDLGIYFATDCFDVTNSCVGPSNTGDQFGADGKPEIRTYTATADTDLFIIVDSYMTGLVGTFDLSVEVTP